MAVAKPLPGPVVMRARLGHNIEDIDYVPSGSLAGRIAILDGYDVYTSQVKSNGIDKITKQCDLHGLGLHAGPRGIAHILSEDVLVVVEPSQPDQLFVFDKDCKDMGARTIQYMGGFMPAHVEALETLPPNAPIHPNHLMMVAEQFTATGIEMRIEILSPGGTVVDEILPPAPIGESFISGLSFVAPDKLLVTMADNAIWTLDLDGNVVAGPMVIDEAGDIEGVVQIADGRVVAADLQSGTLAFLNANLQRLPSDDRSYQVGLGVNWTLGLAWDSDNDEHLVAHFVAPFGHDIVAVVPSLASSTPVTTLPPDMSFNFRRSMTYLADEHVMAVGLPQGEVLFIDETGAEVDTLDLSALGGIESIEYLPATHEFIIKTPNPGEEQMLHVVTRAGAPVRDIDLSATGVTWIDAVAVFGTGGGQLLVLDHPFVGDKAYVTDLNGVLVSSFNYREVLSVIRPFEVAAITSGPQAGSLALIDDYASELVVFNLP